MTLSILGIPILSWPHPRWALCPSNLGRDLGEDGDCDPENPEHPNPLLFSLQVGFSPCKRWKGWKEMGTVILSIPILSLWALSRSEMGKDLGGDGDCDPEHPEHPKPLLESLQVGFAPLRVGKGAEGRWGA